MEDQTKKTYEQLMLETISEKQDINEKKTPVILDAAFQKFYKNIMNVLADINHQTLERIDSVDGRRLDEDRINFEYFNERFEILEKKCSANYLIAIRNPKSIIIILSLSAGLALSILLNFRLLNRSKQNELNALKYQVLHFSEEETMQSNALRIDAYFLDNPIKQIRTDVRRLELQEKTRLYNFHLAQEKESSAKKLIEEAKKLKN